MSIPSEDVVRKALKPLETVLVSSFRRAWKDWRTAGLSHWRKRGRANYVWEQAAHYAAIALTRRDEVKVLLQNESYHFLVGDSLAFRLKKADSLGFTSNYPTPQALAFHDPQMPLTGVPVEQRVEVTYTLNRAETAIQDVLVVARQIDRVVWTYSLLDSAATAAAALPTVPASETNKPSNSKSSGLVKPKKAKGGDGQSKTEERT